MVLLPSNLDYTDKDFDALRVRMFNLIDSVFPTWSDKSKANFANILVESFAWLVDILCFYQDQQAREGRWGTAVIRKSLIAMGKLINYVLPGATAASADVVITISNASALTGTVTPVGAVPVVVKTEAITDPIRGEIVSPLPFTIDVATGFKEFQWEHSLTQPPFIVASTSLADQKYLLPFGPFLDDGSDEVSTVSQGTFTRVTSFLNSGPTDAHYRIQVDQNDRAEVIFGDGNNGVIPVGNITVNYRTGGGIFGNVEPGALKKVEGSFVDSVGNPAYLIASNAVGAQGGEPREEVEAARVNGPESIRVVNRTVAREDYEINAKKVNGVGRALMLTSNEDVSIDENRGFLYIVPSTGGDPSQTMLDNCEYICTVTYPNTITFQFEARGAVYLAINVYAVVFLREEQVPSTAKASILSDLADYFEPMLASGAPNPNIDFGFNYKDADGLPAGEIAWSDIHNVVRDNPAVRKVGPGATDFTLNGLHDDVPIPNWQFPKLGTVTIINGDTGNAI